MKIMRNVLALLAVVMLAGAGAASAATIIFDNSAAHPGGTLTFGTSTAPAPAVLTSGVIDLVTKLDGAIVSFPVTSSGAFNCGSPLSGFGCLNFTTGAFISQSTLGATTTFTYGPGGSLTINGAADGASGLLFSAPTGFNGNVSLAVNSATMLAALSGTLNPGTLNATLAAALGVTPGTPGGTDNTSAANITFTGVFGAGTGSGAATTNSVQLSNVTPQPAIPEPASIFLMAGGLIGVGCMGWRRSKRT